MNVNKALHISILQSRMIYTTKKELANNLGVCRITINRMIRDKEVKEIVNQKGKRVGYVKVIDMIRYLLN